MRRLPLLSVLAALPACSGPPPCPADPAPFRERLACAGQFEALAARPLDSSLPGAFTVKTLIDQSGQSGQSGPGGPGSPAGAAERVYFTDTRTYPLHRGFAVEHLGWPRGMPFAGEYYLPERRFLLGAVTRYEAPGVWAYELAPYDTSDAAMVVKAFRLIAGATFFGGELRFHPTSAEQARLVAQLPPDVPVVTTEELYAHTSYQPLNLGETVGQVRMLRAAELKDTYIGPREIAVLDRVPDDITVVAAVVTEELQTPLSHINVLSQQRGTPNMGLRDAAARFAPHAGRWVRLRVGAFAYEVQPVGVAEAEAWWAARRPKEVRVPKPDLGRTDLPDVDTIGLADLAAFGGKAAHLGELRRIQGLRVPRGFAIPVFYYTQFLRESGFDQEIAAMLAEERFRADGLWRRQRLAALQERMLAAPVPQGLLQAVEARIQRDFSGTRMRFRSSTNAEDLDGHSGAGLYDSESGELGSDRRPVPRAIKKVWASLWNFRAFEEREHAGIAHGDVAMAILCHPTYVDELANGVAITGNVFDRSPDGEDAFYINAQVGEESVVSPRPGVVAEQILYFYYHLGQPATYLARSSLAPQGATVLSRAELFELGTALDLIRTHFARHYRSPDGGPLMMDVEWKLVADGAERRIEVKQARPYPGRGR